MYTFGVEIILFYPDEVAFRNVENYKKKFDKVLVYDNTPKKDINYTLKKTDGLTYLSSGQNLGMSVALEEGILWAEKQNIDYLLTMDQDSDYDEKNIQIAKETIEKSSDSKVAIFGSNYRKIMYGKDGCPVYLESRYKKGHDREVSFCMTSGSFMNVSLVKQFLPLENLFIGFVDNALCYKLRVKGYELRLISNSIFSQRVGAEVRNNWFNRFLHKVNLSNERYFFMGRNSLFLIKKIKSAKIRRELVIARIRILINIILCEKNGVAKFKEWIRGSKEGFFLKFDKN